MRIAQHWLAGCAGIAILGIAASAPALDLTGSWTGMMQCTSFLQTLVKSRGPDNELQILQVDNPTSANDDVFMSLNGGTLMRGVVFKDFNDPNKGAVAFSECGTSSNLTGSNLLGQAKVSTGKRARFLATVVHAEGTGSNPVSWVETCRLTLTRTNTTSPSLPTLCPLVP